MNRTFIAVLLATTAFCSAQAADLARPIYKAPVAVGDLPVIWNGFYLGGNLGYGWGKVSAANSDGFSGGGQAGYNYQLLSNLVVGVEADVLGSGIDAPARPNLNYTTNIWGTVRGRIGYAFNNVLVYGTGGFAWSHADLSFNGVAISNAHKGYAAGGGIEYAFAPNWSAKIEYLYVDLDRRIYSNVFAEPSFSVVRLGVNYRFGGAPIVASY